MAGQLSSIQTSSETLFGEEDDRFSIRTLNDSDFDLDSEDELKLPHMSDHHSEEEPEVSHISYLDQMKYFERHEDPPVAKVESKVKGMTKSRSGTGEDPERVVFEYKDLSMNGDSELCKLHRMSPEDFGKLVDDFLDKALEEPEPSQAEIEATAQYEALIEVIRQGDTEYKKLRAEMKELRAALKKSPTEPREHSLFAAGSNPLSINFRIVQRPAFSFDLMAFLAEPMDDDEFEDLIYAFYDGVYGRRVIRRPPVVIDLTGED